VYLKQFKYSSVHTTVYTRQVYAQIFRYAGRSSSIHSCLADTEAGSIRTAEEKEASLSLEIDESNYCT
jgi:hypothetical protein